MTNFKIDRLKFTFRQDWNSDTDYYRDDIVYYAGKAYVCIEAHDSSGQFETNEFKWELMFDGREWRGDWELSTYYFQGDIVKYFGYIYRCITSHTSTNLVFLGLPGDADKWILVAKTPDWTGEWEEQTRYSLGSVVRYNGNLYICQIAHASAQLSQGGLEQDSEKWNTIALADNWREDWNTEVRYIRGDIVKYNGSVYRCIEGHLSNDSFEQGLEEDSEKWETVLSGVSYKGEWQESESYKLNDIVRFGETLYIAQINHTSSGWLSDEPNWQIFLPGLGFEEVWNEETVYGEGDIVLHGGYTYVAVESNSNTVPSTESDNTAWTLLDEGYKIRGEWDAEEDYQTGDIVRNGGFLYVAQQNNSGTQPNASAIWKTVIPGSNYLKEWQLGKEYYIGDVIVFRGTSYYCIDLHTSDNTENRPDIDIENATPLYWKILIQGTPSNVLAFRGDLQTFDSEKVNLNIGNNGNLLQVEETDLIWKRFGETEKIYFVSNDGSDDNLSGTNINSPFKTIKFACEFILEDETNRAPATVFISTGVFSEELPISIPAGVALVGDELRSTTVQPAEGFEQENMFFVRDSCGIRNMTLQGLQGELGEPNQYLTRRPSAGAFVSLDPGDGEDDSSVWINNRSPYIQNVSTFGTACIGMKIDGDLHNGGNRSIVANDFTQVLNDGIGYWANSLGRSELVSVFTYFCHIGYLATDGGILRGTNGNNSYGTYGSVAEGIRSDQQPVLGEVNNRSNDAQIEIVLNNQDQITAFGFSNAGENYTTASINVLGSGQGAQVNVKEFRNQAISNIRPITPDGSSDPGGLNYTSFFDFAQSGGTDFIQLSQRDVLGTSERYENLRVFIEFGAGSGQYGYIASYDADTKIARISRESDDSAGWDHIKPGTPIADELNGTTRYRLESRVEIEQPVFEIEIVNQSLDTDWSFVVYGQGKLVAINEAASGQITTAYSTDNGNTWENRFWNLQSPFTVSNLIFTGSAFIATLNDTNSSSIFTSTDGEDWQVNSIPIEADDFTVLVDDGNGNVLIASDSGKIAYSSSGGLSWTARNQIVSNGAITSGVYGKNRFIFTIPEESQIAISEDKGQTWNFVQVPSETIGDSTIDPWIDITYGNNKFVAIAETTNRISYSFDAVTWYDSEIDYDDNYNKLYYNQGIFLALGETDRIAKSYDGRVWTTFDNDSTVYNLSQFGEWVDIVYNTSENNFFAIQRNTSQWNKIRIGAKPIIFPKIENSRIKDFIIYEPGSGYTTEPEIIVYDTEATEIVKTESFVRNGVVAPPEILNGGTGYTTSTAELSGNGYAEIFQTGNTLIVANLTRIPGPGSNLEILGIDELYTVTRVRNIEGTIPQLSAEIDIFPSLDPQVSPEHEIGILINKNFSQIRLTNHDFLDVGTGNVQNTRYPELYVEGVESVNRPQQQNEVVEFGGGRVYYTSTDQDGNFRVGELFQVEQDTGIVTVSASQFDLGGLSELTLGGVRVGGSAVVVREFSKDPLFVANSNNIVPTQRAIASYLARQLAGGGTNVETNKLTASQIVIETDRISATTGTINVTSNTKIEKSVAGSIVAESYFRRRSNR